MLYTPLQVDCVRMPKDEIANVLCHAYSRAGLDTSYGLRRVLPRPSRRNNRSGTRGITAIRICPKQKKDGEYGCVLECERKGSSGCLAGSTHGVHTNSTTEGEYHLSRQDLKHGMKVLLVRRNWSIGR